MFGRRRAAGPTTAPTEPRPPSSIEFAWRVHSAQEAWTAKVDVKASVLLALVGGALFATISAHSKDGLLSDLDGAYKVAEIAGVVLQLGALVLAAGAVFPLLGRPSDHEISAGQGQFIYFGHLRHWNAVDLSRRLHSLSEEAQREMLAEQLINMASRNWRKHRLLQASLVFAIVGIICVAASALWG